LFSFIGVIFQSRKKINYFFVNRLDVAFFNGNAYQQRHNTFGKRLVIEKLMIGMPVKIFLKDELIVLRDKERINAGVVFNGRYGIDIYLCEKRSANEQQKCENANFLGTDRHSDVFSVGKFYMIEQHNHPTVF
jgi:hypothetical protein